MFHGKTYRRFGYEDLCIGFADQVRDDEKTCRSGGVISLHYGCLVGVEKDQMAMRTFAALTMTTHFMLDELERAMPLAGDSSGYVGYGLCGRTFRRLDCGMDLWIGFADRCPLHGVFGKNGGAGAVHYADEIEHADKALMARRVVAALNYVRNFPLHELERKVNVESAYSHC